jgi:hypothetical protein
MNQNIFIIIDILVDRSLMNKIKKILYRYIEYGRKLCVCVCFVCFFLISRIFEKTKSGILRD